MKEKLTVERPQRKWFGSVEVEAVIYTQKFSPKAKVSHARNLTCVKFMLIYASFSPTPFLMRRALQKRLGL